MAEYSIPRTNPFKTEANKLQTRVDLQADCLAGIWANRQNEMLKSQGKSGLVVSEHIEPDLSAASGGKATVQRQRWFENGFGSGSIESCNTFETTQL